MRSAGLAFVAASLIAFTACTEYELGEKNDGSGALGPQIELTPEFLQFGEVTAEGLEVREFTITSVGEEDLEVSNITIGAAGAESFTVLTEDLDFILPPGASTTVEVAFQAMGADVQAAEAQVANNDPDARIAKVQLEGRGMVAELQIDPNPYDFGSTYVGCPNDGEVTLTNVGSDSLEITEIASAGEAFIMENPNALPLVLEPGEAVPVYMDFDPPEDLAYSGSLTVVSSEPMGVREASQTGEGLYAAEYEDRFDVPLDPPSDIMFLVDQSCSMDDDQARLASNFSYFISNLNSFTSDWQVMVVNDDNGCNNSGILRGSTSGYQDRFASAVSRGGGSYTESLLTPASAATRQTNNGQCNAGFMRDGALLHIIFVSDEPEQSSQSWSTLVQQMIDNKGSASLVKLSAIVGDYPSGCGSADPGAGYYEAVNYTNGEFLSICASSWSSYMNVLAEASVSQDTYALAATPLPSTIEVRVNGNVVTGIWHYDSAQNAVVFDSDLPVGGERVLVSYAGSANCD